MHLFKITSQNLTRLDFDPSLEFLSSFEPRSLFLSLAERKRNGPKVDPDKIHITGISSVKRAVEKQAMGTLKLQLKEILVHLSTIWTQTTHFRWITF